MDATKVKTSQPVQAVKTTQRAQEVRQNQERQAKAPQPETRKSPYDAPRPTVNSQGQTIGTRLNVRA